jgi:hypothetical protein
MYQQAASQDQHKHYAASTGTTVTTVYLQLPHHRHTRTSAARHIAWSCLESYTSLADSSEAHLPAVWKPTLPSIQPAVTLVRDAPSYSADHVGRLLPYYNILHVLHKLNEVSFVTCNCWSPAFSFAPTTLPYQSAAFLADRHYHQSHMLPLSCNPVQHDCHHYKHPCCNTLCLAYLHVSNTIRHHQHTVITRLHQPSCKPCRKAPSLAQPGEM